MSTRVWQGIARVGLIALSMGVMAGVAQANNKYCGGGGGQSSCPSWTFDDSGTVLPAGTQAHPYVASEASGFLTSEQSNFQAGHPTVTATAWSNTGDSNTNTTPLQQAYIGAYSHMGVTDAQLNKPLTLTGSGSPTYADVSTTNNELKPSDHAIDNQGNLDSVLFNFGSTAVNLTSFKTGWEATDADYTVLAYTGTGCGINCSTSISGKTYSQLLVDGWALIGNYYVNGAYVGAVTDSAGNKITTHDFSNYNNGTTGQNTTLSSYWLIGALNTAVGGVQDSAYDYFKILSVTGCDCTTNPNLPGCGGGPPAGNPEPGTLFLMGAGLVGLVRTTRRRRVLAA